MRACETFVCGGSGYVYRNKKTRSTLFQFHHIMATTATMRNHRKTTTASRKRKSPCSATTTTAPLDTSFWVERVLSKATSPAVTRGIDQLDPTSIIGMPGHMTKTLGEVAAIAATHPGRVVLYQSGNFYNCSGVHALCLVEFCGLRLQGGQTPKLVAGAPLPTVQRIVDGLSRVGLETVIVVEDTCTSSGRVKRVARCIVGPASPTVAAGTVGTAVTSSDDDRQHHPIAIVWDSGTTLAVIDLVTRTVDVHRGMSPISVESSLMSMVPAPFQLYRDSSSSRTSRLSKVPLSHGTKFLWDGACTTISLTHARDINGAVKHVMRRYLGRALLARECGGSGGNGPSRDPMMATVTSQIGIGKEALSGVPPLITVLMGSCRALYKTMILSWLASNVSPDLGQCMNEYVLQVRDGKVHPPTLADIKSRRPVTSVIAPITTMGLHRCPHVVEYVLDSQHHDHPTELIRCASMDPALDIEQYRTNLEDIRGSLMDLVAGPEEEEEEDKKEEEEEEEEALAELKTHCGYEQLLVRAIKQEARAALGLVRDTIQRGSQIWDFDPVHETLVVYKKPATTTTTFVTIAAAISVLPAGPHGGTMKNKKKRLKTSGSTYTTIPVARAVIAFKSVMARLLKKQERELARWCHDHVLNEPTTRLRVLEIYARAEIMRVAVYHHVYTCTAHGWCVPTMSDNGTVFIEAQAMFPYWMCTSGTTNVIPNDVKIERGSVTIVCAPNAAGKSTMLRTLCVSMLTAAAGLLVPARSYHLATHPTTVMLRLPASDAPKLGLSSFEREATDLARIVRNAGPKSMVILDEVGRSTAHGEALALHQALVKGLRDRGATVIAATHLYSLLDLIPGAVHRTLDDGYRWINGSRKTSMAVQVCVQSGIPHDVVESMKKILGDEEKGKEKGEEKDVMGIVLEIGRNITGSEPVMIQAGASLPITLAAAPAVVYVWEQQDGAIYVGESLDMNRRRREHVHRTGGVRGHGTGCAFVVSNKSRALEAESAIIQALIGAGVTLASVADA